MSSKKKKDAAQAQEQNADAAAPTEKETVKLSAEEQLKQELEAAQKALEQQKNQMLSLAAEYDNFRKRSAKERERIYSDVRGDILKELLPIVDNMERALAGSDADAAGYKKGVEMTFAGLIQLLEKSGVTAFGAVGDDFDPAFYNAVMHVEDETIGEQKVVEVFQKGYKNGDRILREAMVKVAN